MNTTLPNGKTIAQDKSERAALARKAAKKKK